ncbi:MAG: hypothetical protein K2H46_05505 [Muribaculaceae bacterium]|nr:hypothetical protein [Muribaculaceae bacterium]
MKHQILVTLILFTAVLSSVADDSIPVNKLEEVVIQAERGWIENGVINVIPTKKEKKLSTSPATLIKAMHLPFLEEKDGAIVTPGGGTAVVFINGVKAEGIDISTFWPKEVKRVECIQDPTDPKYEGVKYAVNFVMTEYEAGGVSKISLFQRVPNNGIYEISSKLVYKKMTYGAMFRGNYLRDHRSSKKAETTYRDIYYNDRKYDEIIQDEESFSYTREDGLNFGLYVRYTNKNFRMTHTFALGWDRNPGSGSSSVSSWSENLFGSEYSFFTSSSRSISPQAGGNYFYRFNPKWTISALWNYNYARNDNWSTNKTGDTSPIFNTIKEDVNTFKLTLFPAFKLSDKWNFYLNLVGTFDWFSTRYAGSANTLSRQTRQEINSEFIISWIASQKLRMYFYPGFNSSFWQIGDLKEHSVSPTFSTSVDWNPTRKFMFSGSLRYNSSFPSASESNPVLVKNSELLWSVGNPSLKKDTSWDTYLYATYLTTKWLSFGAGLGYLYKINDILTEYRPADREMGGLVMEKVNISPVHDLRGSLSIKGHFFDRNLSVSLTPQWFYTATEGNLRRHRNYFTFSGGADYTIGNVNLEVDYDGPFKHLDEGGREEYWRQGGWNVGITYGTGDLYIKFKLSNIFNDKQRIRVNYTSPYYSTNYNSFETGRNGFIQITYTFGYGKKIDRNIYVQGAEESKTSINKAK